MQTPKSLLLALSLAIALGAAPAVAETIHTPAEGAATQEDQAITFDWAWDTDQYASYLYFADTADPNDPIWFGANTTGRPRVRVSDHGSPFLHSNATFVPKSWSLTPGTWYWRVCSFTINGEDDKCYFRSPPRAITITAAPAPPPTPTPTPTPAPTPTPSPTPAPASADDEQRPSFTRDEAVQFARLAIKQQFSYGRTPRGARITCARAARATQINGCRASWSTTRCRYAGAIRVSPLPFSPADVVELKTDPSILEDNDYWFTIKLQRINRRTGASKTLDIT